MGLWKNRLRLIGGFPVGLWIEQCGLVFAGTWVGFSKLCRLFAMSKGSIDYTHLRSIDLFSKSIIGIGEFNYSDTRHYRPWQVK